MDYLLGVLFATKKYEALDTSRLQHATNAGATFLDAIGARQSPLYADVTHGGGSDVEDGENSDHTLRDGAIPASFVRRRTARPTPGLSTGFSSTFTPGTFLKGGMDASSSRSNSTSGVAATTTGGGVDGQHSSGEEEGEANAARRLSVMRANLYDTRRLSASHSLAGAAAPREGVAALSPLLPGLSVSAAALTALDGGSLAAPTARPQRLEYSVPTKVLAGKYVLVYLPAPHRPSSYGAGAAGLGATAGGGGSAIQSLSGTTSSVPNAVSSTGGGGGNSRSIGPSSVSGVMSSPQVEPLKARLGNSASASSLLASGGGVGPHSLSSTSHAATPSRGGFVSGVQKPMEAFASGGTSPAHHSYGLAAALQGGGGSLPPSAVRAAAVATVLHQKLLLFYCLLLHRLAHRPAGERTPATVLEDEEGGLAVTTAEVPVAVLELHYTTEGPLRNGIFGPSSASAMSQAASDTLGGTASSLSPAATGGGGGSGGGPLDHSPSPSSSLTSFVAPGSYGGGGGGGGGGRSSMNLAAQAYPGPSSNAPSAMASPRLLTPRLGSSMGNEASTRLDLMATDDAPSEAPSSRLLSTILRHLQEGKPDAWLLPDSVVFDSEMTQNPHYGGWYSVDSNDGYRRVMQHCGLQSWPAVVLFDPAGNVVTVSALQHVEEELAQFTAEVEGEMVKAAVAWAAAQTKAAHPAATAAARAAPNVISATTSPSPPQPVISVDEQITVDRPDLEEGGAVASPDAQPPLHVSQATQVTEAAEDGGNDGAATATAAAAALASSPSVSVPQEGLSTDTGSSHAADGASATAAPAATLSPRTVPLGVWHGREDSVPERSSLLHSLAATVEGMPQHTRCDDTDGYTPTRMNESESLSGDLREPSMPYDDPKVPTAEPTPVKKVPVTARYREGSRAQASAIPLSAAMSTPRADGSDGSDDVDDNDDGHPPHSEAGSEGTWASPGTVVAAASAAMADAPPVTSTVTEAALPVQDASAVPAAAVVEQEEAEEINQKKTNGGEKEEEKDDNNASANLSVRPMAQLSMPVLQESAAEGSAVGANAAAAAVATAAATPGSCSPSYVSGPKEHSSLPSWNPRAYGGDVAAIIAVNGSESEADTPIHAASPGTNQQQQQQQQQRPRTPQQEGTPGRDAATPAANSTASAAPHTTFGASNAGSVGGSHGGSARPSGAFSAAPSVPAVLTMPPVQLPAFSSRFPWNMVMAEPIMVYATPPQPPVQPSLPPSQSPRQPAQRQQPQQQPQHSHPGKHREEGGEEGSLETVQSAFQRHLQSRVAERKRRASPAAGALCQAQAAAAEAGEEERFLSSSGASNGYAGHSGAAVVTPTAMVLRQSLPSGHSSLGGGGRGSSSSPTRNTDRDDGDDEEEERSPTAKAATAQLELTTFSETSPLLVTQRSWSVHPLRRLAYCSVAVEEVRERARAAANGNYTICDDDRTEQMSAAVMNAAAAGAGARGHTLGSVMMASLSIGDSTDDDVNRTSRSPSPPSHLARQHVPRPRLSLEGVPPPPPQTPSVVMENWLQEAAAKFESSTHLLLLFGAGWHPGMPKCVRAVRRLCDALRERTGEGADASGGDKPTSSRGGGGGGNGFGNDGDNDGFFPALRGFGSSPAGWASSGGFGHFNMSEGEGLEEEGEEEGRSSPQLLGRPSMLRNRENSTSRSGITAQEPSVSGAAGGRSDHASTGLATAAAAAASCGGADPNNAAPRRRLQVIYISADESLQEVCSAVATMPPTWLCLSPHIAQTVAERQLQQHASDVARSIFNVNAFPRLVVVELPSPPSPSTTSSAQAPLVAAASAQEQKAPAAVAYGEGDDEEEGFAVTTTTTSLNTTQQQMQQQQQQQQWERQFDGLWAVVQLHAETRIYADPEGKEFPWSTRGSDVLRITQEDLSAMPKEGRQAWSYLLSGFSQQQQQQQRESRRDGETANANSSIEQSPMLYCASPEDAEVPSLIRSHPEMLVTMDREKQKKGREGGGAGNNYNHTRDNDEDGDTASITRAPSPPPLPLAVTRTFPPVKPFVVGDGELHRLLEKGGFFVVLGAFGSVDAQLHQQCASALEEVREWLYAEVEARKEQAWAEPTRLQVMAPHGSYATSFTVGGDRVVLSPALGGTPAEEYATPTRFSSGFAASPPLLTPGGGPGAAAMASAARLLHGPFANSSNNTYNNSSSSGNRLGTPFMLEEGWPEGRTAFNTSPKFTASSPPLHGFPGGLQLDGTVGSYSFQLTHSTMGSTSYSGGGTISLPNTNKPAPQRILPSVFFYDSILTNPRGTAAGAHSGAGDGAAAAADGHGGLNSTGNDRATDGLRGGLAAVWRNASPTPLRANSPSHAAAAALAPRDSTNAATSPSPQAPAPHVLDNTASLRRRHAKDLAMLQEYVIAPIIENDEKMLPVREGEVYLAVVRWPQRAAVVLRRRLASEVKAAPTSATTATTASTAAAAGERAGSTSSSSASTATATATPSGSTGGVSVSSTASSVGATASGTSRGSTAASQSPGQSLLLPEALVRRPTTSPSPLSPMAAGGASQQPPGTQAPSPVAASVSASVSPSAATTGAASTAADRNSPSMTATMHTPAATSLSATLRTEEDGKEGSPDPDATPLASAEAIKSFLYEHILRSMAA